MLALNLSWKGWGVEMFPQISLMTGSAPKSQSLADFIRRWWTRIRQSGRRRPRRLRLCESLALGERRFVAVVEFEQARFLLGGTSASLVLLARLENPGGQAVTAGRPTKLTESDGFELEKIMPVKIDPGLNQPGLIQRESNQQRTSQPALNLALNLAMNPAPNPALNKERRG